MLTDQNCAADEPIKEAGELDQPAESEDKPNAEEDTDDLYPRAAQWIEADPDSKAHVDKLIEKELELIWKLTGIQCSLQQVLPVPNYDGWIIAASLYKIHEGVKSSKLVEAKGRGLKFKQFATVEDDDTFKPGEYIDVSFYEDVNYGEQEPCHYKYRHSFIVSNPIKFWHMIDDQEIANWYDILLSNEKEVFFFFGSPMNDGSDEIQLKHATIDL